MARYVAVADSDRKYAGYDGGPGMGGIGRWRTGAVGEWKSTMKLPLAERDPATGLIHKGWIEECEDVARKDDGSFVCLKSKRVYSTPQVIINAGQRYAVVGDTLRPAGPAEVSGEPPLAAVGVADERPHYGDALKRGKPAKARPSAVPPNAGQVE